MKSVFENLNLSILDLFSVLLPGATMALLLAQIGWLKNTFFTLLPQADSEWQGAIAFFIAAYFLGYMVYVLGAFLDKPVDDWWQKRDQSTLVDRVTPLKVQEIGFHEQNSLNNYQWAMGRIMMEKPDMYAEVERYQATAKFFRSITAACFLSALPLFFVNPIIALCAFVISLLSLYLYQDRRKKSLHIAYKRVITMLGAPSEYPKEIKDLNELNILIGEAEKKKDYPFLNAVLDDSLVFRRASGKVVDKRTYLRDLAGITYLEMTSNIEDPVESEDKRSAYVVVHVTVKKEGEQKPFTYRNERLFHLDGDGRWKLVGWMNEKEKA